MTSIFGPVSERVQKACRQCTVLSTTTTTTTTRVTTTTTTTLPAYSCPVEPVIPMTSENSFCNVDDKMRQDCGYYGINKDSCESRGCCWRPSQVNGPYPWCFCATGTTTTTPPPYSCPVDPVIPMESASAICEVEDGSRQECGWLGIDGQTCEARGCCYRPTEVVDGAVP
eukprot:5693338-Amphidinium_carterae.1